MTILRELADASRERVKATSERIPLSDMAARAEAMTVPVSFEAALRTPGLSFICEIKRASPSKGLIAESFPYLEIAEEYRLGGADAISVLTEPTKFLGCNKYLKAISDESPLPCLRKDFIIDEYQIYEAKTLGASAVLLIVSLLPDNELRAFHELARKLGLAVLTETRDETEIARALEADAAIIGVNNRDLSSFSVDSEHSLRLRESVPGTVLFVAESGIRSRKDVLSLEQIGADAALIGEALMTADDRIAKLFDLRGV